jgi:hypothetical protein
MLGRLSIFGKRLAQHPPILCKLARPEHMVNAENLHRCNNVDDVVRHYLGDDKLATFQEAPGPFAYGEQFCKNVISEFETLFNAEANFRPIALVVKQVAAFESQSTPAQNTYFIPYHAGAIEFRKVKFVREIHDEMQVKREKGASGEPFE